MKSDIDALMEQNQVDVLWVMGPAIHNPPMVYLTGGGHITRADLFKKRGQAPLLFHESMERDEAVKTGLETRSMVNYPFKQLLEEAGGDAEKAGILRYRRILNDLGITTGRVALYGQVDAGTVTALTNGLRPHFPEIEFIGFSQDPILMKAMMVKDAVEIERIRQAGVATVGVVRRIAEFLTGRALDGEVLLDDDGQPLTVEAVKRRINLWLAEAGLENPEATIFALGADAGVPHSAGTPSDVLRLGVPIVFDIFPCEAGGGYFYDFTRTWCLGYASKETQVLYDQVNFVYNQLVSELEVNAPFKRYQERTCEIFEEMNHPTILTHPGTEEGYVHSLGHGVGLNIHEKPFSGMGADPQDLLAPGTVFTLEPGLYYPSRGQGIRLEDTYTVTPDGRFEKLVDFPMDLVLPMKG